MNGHFLDFVCVLCMRSEWGTRIGDIIQGIVRVLDGARQCYHSKCGRAKADRVVCSETVEGRPLFVWMLVLCGLWISWRPRLGEQD